MYIPAQLTSSHLCRRTLPCFLCRAQQPPTAAPVPGSSDRQHHHSPAQGQPRSCTGSAWCLSTLHSTDPSGQLPSPERAQNLLCVKMHLLNLSPSFKAATLHNFMRIKKRLTISLNYFGCLFRGSHMIWCITQCTRPKATGLCQE